ncbi:MAG: hypothetical protein NTZ34_00865 [Chloroflexi bacterium]|nr:hypothetical protein [Chloroflexota bacterium]
MKKKIIVIAGLLLILQAFLIPLAAYADDDEYGDEDNGYDSGYDEFDVGDNKYLLRPSSLKDAVDEIHLMIEQKKSRWEIAKRAATIADGRIINVNDTERMSIPANWFSIFKDSKETEAFRAWSKQQNDEGPYNKTAAWVWDSRVGMCAENAALVYYLLKEAGATDLHIINRGGPDHRFVAWGLGEGDPNNKESWTDNVIVPDSWQGKVLKGQAAWKNGYCGNMGNNSGDGLLDHTFAYDESAPMPCGRAWAAGLVIKGKLYTGGKRSPCCKTIKPCRGDPRLECFNDHCVRCGQSKGQPCCTEGKPCIEGLKCVNSFCIESGKEAPVDWYWGSEYTGSFNLQAKDWSTNTINITIVPQSNDYGAITGNGKAVKSDGSDIIQYTFEGIYQKATSSTPGGAKCTITLQRIAQGKKSTYTGSCGWGGTLHTNGTFEGEIFPQDFPVYMQPRQFLLKKK